MPTTEKDSQEPEYVSTWLSLLFSLLEDRGAVYAALRFDRTLLQPDCEIDILVHPTSLTGVLDGIRDMCARFPHLKVAYWRSMPRHAATIILVWLDSDRNWRHYVFDIRCGIHKKRFVLLHGSALRRLTVWDARLGTRRLRDDYEVALLTIRNVLDQREYKPRHIAIVSERSGDSFDEAMQYMGWRLTDSDGARIARVSHGWPRRLVTYVRYAFGALLGRLRQTVLSVNVVIYGPDGVGKSTQAQLIADFFSSHRIRRVHVYHHLVEVGALASGASNRRKAIKTRAYGNAVRPWMLNGIVTFSYLKKLLIVVGQLRPMLRRGHFLVHDRYLLDVFQKFYKVHGIRLKLLERLLSPLTPRERFVIVLQAPPELVSDRTGELAPEEVAAAYRLLFDCLAHGGRRFDGWTLVDASQSIDDTHDRIVHHVLDIQTRRALGHRSDLIE